MTGWSVCPLALFMGTGLVVVTMYILYMSLYTGAGLVWYPYSVNVSLSVRRCKHPVKVLPTDVVASFASD